MNAIVRPLTAQDLPGLLAVQRACYGDGYVESAAVYARRLACPTQCSVVLERAGQLCAYLAAYDSLAGKVTPLHGDFEAANPPDTLYLHDMAVLPTLAGRGLARVLLQSLWQHASAQGLQHAALVSVQGSQGYWERHGFALCSPHGDAQRQHLASYGTAAVYMRKPLAAPAAATPLP